MIGRFWGAFFLLGFLLEELFGLCAHFLILLKGFCQGSILFVAQFEAGFCFDFSQFALLLKELHCRLESDVQLAYGFI